MKNRVKGFTMMELIVVMAILAVLCGVLVPNGLAWIRDSKLKTCNSEAKTVFNTAVTVLQDYQLEGKVNTLTSADGQLKLEKGDGTTASTKITSKLGSNFGENSVWYVNSTVTNYSDRNNNQIRVISALFADSTSAVYIGRYPVPANLKASGSYSTVKDSVINPTEGVADAIYDGT